MLQWLHTASPFIACCIKNRNYRYSLKTQDIRKYIITTHSVVLPTTYHKRLIKKKFHKTISLAAITQRIHQFFTTKNCIPKPSQQLPQTTPTTHHAHVTSITDYY
eukprot:11025296-Ditylum_brightwellii.AAC.1